MYFQNKTRGVVDLKMMLTSSALKFLFTLTIVNCLAAILAQHNQELYQFKPPKVEVVSTTSESIKLAIKLSEKDVWTESIPGFYIHVYSHVQHRRLLTKFQYANETSVVIDGIQCGTKYMFYTGVSGVKVFGQVKAFEARTKGTKPFLRQDFPNVFSATSASIQLKLGVWDDGGCPIQSFSVEFKPKDKSDWIVASDDISPELDKYDILELRPATYYIIKVTAQNSVGSTIREFEFATLAANGVEIDAPTREEMVRLKSNISSLWEVISNMKNVLQKRFRIKPAEYSGDEEFTELLSAECSQIDQMPFIYLFFMQKNDFSGPLMFEMSLYYSDDDKVENNMNVLFQIHEDKVEDGNCSSAGDYFNPEKNTDLKFTYVGNLTKDKPSKVTLLDPSFQFIGKHSILGRSVVFYTAEDDDLGTEGDEGSLVSGAQARTFGCCNIVPGNIPEPRKASAEARIRFNG